MVASALLLLKSFRFTICPILGSCYKDKLKALQANISEELQIVTTSISTLNQCKMKTKAMIVGGTSPNVTMSFEKYKNCTVNIDCTLAEIKFLLEQKMLKTNNEIQLETMGYGDFQMTGTVFYIVILVLFNIYACPQVLVQSYIK